MKTWYEMTKEELKEAVREEKLDLFTVNLVINGIFQKGDEKIQKATPLLIKVFRELIDENHKFSKEYLFSFSEDLLCNIIRRVKLTEDANNDIIEKYYYDDYLIFLLVRHQSFTKENMEKYFTLRSSDADMWYLYTYQDLENYPLLVLEYANYNAIPPEYFITKFNWNEIFKEKLSQKIIGKIALYILNYDKGSKISDLMNDEFVDDYFDESDDYMLWDDLSMDERLVNIESEEYYDKESDTLYINYWQYIISRLIQTQEIDEELMKVIRKTISYNRVPQDDFCKNIAEKYGEAAIRIFIKIYSGFKNDNIIDKIDHLIEYFGVE